MNRVLRGVRAFAPAVPSISTASTSRRIPPPQVLKRNSSTLPSTSLSHDAAPNFAFAFDIDGVLLHVSNPIPGATTTLRHLQTHHIPFILLTNGGGKLESDRVSDLSTKLSVPLSTSNFVQSHTPFRQLVPSLSSKTILVTGSDYARCRSIFQSYGFQHVLTPADILAAYPTIFPFRHLSELRHDAQPLPRPVHTSPTHAAVSDDSNLKIDAIFVLDDPRDWSVDIQIITDLLLSHQGYLGTHSPLNGDCTLSGCGWQSDGQPELYFSNGDLEWSANWHLPRFGQGAFQAALAGVWKRYTGGHELRRQVIGKPEGSTYEFAEGVLERFREDELRRLGKKGCGLGRVYMVGDNPESDIAGANGFRSPRGTEWVSVLVRTGVWRGRELEEGKRPRVVVDDVRAAVEWALRREGWS